MGRKIKGINKEALNMFAEYSFAGNIRELRNLMERAVILCTEEELLPKHFDIIQHFNNPVSTDTLNLEELEKNAILKALSKAHNNKAEASRLLGIEWNALYRRLQKYDIEIQ